MREGWMSTPTALMTMRMHSNMSFLGTMENKKRATLQESKQRLELRKAEIRKLVGDDDGDDDGDGDGDGDTHSNGSAWDGCSGSDSVATALIDSKAATAGAPVIIAKGSRKNIEFQQQQKQQQQRPRVWNHNNFVNENKKAPKQWLPLQLQVRLTTNIAASNTGHS
jgi:hypothetical protein